MTEEGAGVEMRCGQPRKVLYIKSILLQVDESRCCDHANDVSVFFHSQVGGKAWACVNYKRWFIPILYAQDCTVNATSLAWFQSVLLLLCGM